MHLTVIDDNPQVIEVFCDALDSDFKINAFDKQEAALSFLKQNATDAILLDLHMPGKNGFTLYHELRTINPQIPILFVTADSALSLKIQGLELGADDFISKPFDMEELRARIKNRIQHARKSRSISGKIQIKDLSINIEAQEVLLNKASIKLTPKEFQLLLLLVQRPNKVIPKEEFIKLLWKGNEVEMNNIDTHFSNLRRKLKPFSEHIKTLKNLGYVLRI
jgi:DNA-binding response OmpR family regulator